MIAPGLCWDDRLLAATPAHAEVLAAIHAECFPAPARLDAAAMAAQLGLPGTFGLLDPAGAMVLARSVAEQAEILTLAVVPTLRRLGRARSLLHAAACRAAATGAREMFLEVATNNCAARALYSAAGYAEVGRRRRYYPDGSDALVLRAPLSPAAAADG
jgi:ribosomal-protein-alanine N-acetyltransferase